MALLEQTGAYLEGHFLLTSGRHSDRYFEKFRVLEHPEHAELLCSELARRFEDMPIDVVIGPAVGGIIIAYEVARQLGARAIFAEREAGQMRLRRGFAIESGENVLVVEDVVTTGGSVREVIALVEQTDSHIQGIGILMDRSGGDVDLGYRLEALVSLDIRSYAPVDCPLCRRGIPIAQRGSRSL
ncbi:MAG: orotate phosphoribosyltransferase [Firmicutes bacterium]|nr:orotate phosphoribosyltransferase [Bacillota bacterium]